MHTLSDIPEKRRVEPRAGQLSRHNAPSRFAHHLTFSIDAYRVSHIVGNATFKLLLSISNTREHRKLKEPFNSQGFVIMELLIAVAVVLVLAAAGVIVYNQHSKAKTALLILESISYSAD